MSHCAQIHNECLIPNKLQLPFYLLVVLLINVLREFYKIKFQFNSEALFLPLLFVRDTPDASFSSVTFRKNSMNRAGTTSQHSPFTLPLMACRHPPCLPAPCSEQLVWQLFSCVYILLFGVLVENFLDPV